MLIFVLFIIITIVIIATILMIIIGRVLLQVPDLPLNRTIGLPPHFNRFLYLSYSLMIVLALLILLYRCALD